MSTQSTEIRETLCERGIHPASADKLIQKFPPDYLHQKIDVLEFILHETSHRIANPAGYLFQSIEQDYTPPENYKPRAQREAEAKRRAQIIAERKTAKIQEQIKELAHRNSKLRQKIELEIAGQLAEHMDAETEIKLRDFINDQRPSFLQSCDGYDIRARRIKSKSRDLAAGTFFSFLRLEFFKKISPTAFDQNPGM